jgi:hypothetical protein
MTSQLPHHTSLACKFNKQTQCTNRDYHTSRNQEQKPAEILMHHPSVPEATALKHAATVIAKTIHFLKQILMHHPSVPEATALKHAATVIAKTAHVLYCQLQNSVTINATHPHQ